MWGGYILKRYKQIIFTLFIIIIFFMVSLNVKVRADNIDTVIIKVVSHANAYVTRGNTVEPFHDSINGYSWTEIHHELSSGSGV